MKLQRPLYLFLLLLLLSACAPSAATATPLVVSVSASSAAQPWLTELYDCAVSSGTIIGLSDSQSVPDIRLQVGEPKVLSSFVYQIDTEEILIVTDRQSPVQNLTVEDARVLFAGQGDPSVQVWVYASGEDVQNVFDQFVMEGRSVTSSAMVAATAQQMSDTVNGQSNVVGILPKHWKVGDSRFVYTIPNIPVLAITQSEPTGVIKDLLVCMQE